MMMSNKVGIVAGALVLAACMAGGAQGGPLRASAVKVDVTPTESKYLEGYGERRSTSVHDHIFQRVVALDDGATQFFFISSEFCLISPSLYDEFAARLKRELGIDPLQVWWTTTHTHSAPEVGPFGLPQVMMPDRYHHPPDKEYTAFVENQLVDAIRKARATLEPARLAVGTGYSAANINRRARDPEGHIHLGLNPDGPTDRQIGLVRLERPDGTPIALLANYAMHGTALGSDSTVISGDAPGTVAAYVEEKVGAPLLYLNGAAGNMAPIYEVRHDVEDARLPEFNVLLGNRILDANRSLAAGVSEVRLRPGERIVETPRRKGFGWDPELARYLAADKGENGAVRVPVRFLIVNDELALWSAPVELSCEIAINVRGRSPYRHTFFIGYANGWFGYLATRQAFHEGGYEARTCPFTEQVEDDLMKTVLPYLQGHGSN